MSRIGPINALLSINPTPGAWLRPDSGKADTSWRRGKPGSVPDCSDMNQALRVAQEDEAVDQEYGTALRALVTYMMEDARSISSVLDIMWALRSLERIGDHARNLAEHVVYLVKGRDVRHVGLKEMEAQVKK